MTNNISHKLTKEQRAIRALKKSRIALFGAWIGIIILMIWMIPMWINGKMIGGSLFTTLFLFVVSSIIVFGCGRKVITSAWISAKHWSPNMHVLTAIGTIAALSTGLLNILHEFGFFSAIGNFTGIAGMIMGFHLTGSYIEQSLKRKSTHAIKSLTSLIPQHATIITHNKESLIPIAELQVNDIIIIRTGEQVASDGIIVGGQGEIDESLVTGENLPVIKGIDHTVIGGSIVIDGHLVVRVKKIGKKTFLRQIIRLVEMAQADKPQIQLLADKVISIFVPTILIIASITFVSWLFFYNQLYSGLLALLYPLGITLHFQNFSAITMAIFSSIAVLVVACPCALGLATPSAIATGIGRCAQMGVLIKHASIFENLTHADTILMDKTGTITHGKPSVVEVFTTKKYHLDNMLYYAAVLEQGSSHPLAQAVMAYYMHHTGTEIISHTEKALPMALNFKTFHGEGIRGTVDGSHIFITHSRYLHTHNHNISEALQTKIADYSRRGLTISTVIKDDDIMGIIGFEDKPREDSAKAIALLQKMNLVPHMLTGDNKNAAHLIADQVKITQVIAESTPAHKLNIVKKLQTKGHRVIMVGDGINDAPALTQANVGVAMGTGTDVAGEAGDIILLKSTLPTLVSTLKLSRHTYRVITQNLFWAFFYNVLLIPLSMMGMIHPLYAEIAMGISSITVLLNSSRISKFRIKH